MMQEQRAVQGFHETFGLAVSDHPGELEEPRRALRIALMREELDELEAALTSEPLEAQAKELADLLYVVLGTAVELGIDLGAVFGQVHASNMSKLWSTEDAMATDAIATPTDHKDGNGNALWIVRREDGKALKPPTYRPPVIQL